MSSDPGSRSVHDLWEQLATVGDSPDDVRAVFAALVAEHGRERASALWWAVFGATDASET